MASAVVPNSTTPAITGANVGADDDAASVVSRLSTDSDHQHPLSRTSSQQSMGSGHHAPSHTVPSAPAAAISGHHSTSSASASASGKAISSNFKHRPSWRNSWWWWWELGGVLLSMTAMFSIIILLAIWSESPLDNWKFSIQINSLIATLTTVGKTAMLVAVTESISQLKWLYFYKNARPLVRFQEFDDASRGPWGSLMLLWATKATTVLASVGAAITILGLAIEPMAQQIIEFPSRNVTRVGNATLGIATVYTSASVIRGESSGTSQTTDKLLSLQSAMINGIVGRVPDPQFSCPAGSASCTWPAFKTLGFCATYENLTDFQSNCTQLEDSYTMYCDYTHPKIDGVDNERPNNPIELEGGTDYWKILRMWYDPVGTSQPGQNQSMLFASFLTDGGITTVTPKDPITVSRYGSRVNEPRVDIQKVTWDWCERRYEAVSATPGTIADSPYTSEYLVYKENAPENHVEDGYYYHGPNSSDSLYALAFATRGNVKSWYFAFLNTSEWTSNRYTSGNSGVKPNDKFDLAMYMKSSNLSALAHRVADTITNQIRSHSGPSLGQNYGDNDNATFITGEVLVTETYIKVRWPWIILPLLETVLAAGLLICSMVISSGKPLWKSSAIAPLVHGLEGWTTDELYVAPEQESKGSLERLAKGMTTALDGNEHGHLKFLRQNAGGGLGAVP